MKPHLPEVLALGFIGCHAGKWFGALSDGARSLTVLGVFSAALIGGTLGVSRFFFVHESLPATVETMQGNLDGGLSEIRELREDYNDHVVAGRVIEIEVAEQGRIQHEILRKVDRAICILSPPDCLSGGSAR